MIGSASCALRPSVFTTGRNYNHVQRSSVQNFFFSSSSSTTNNTQDDAPPSKSKPPLIEVNNTRSKAQVQALVQNRVKERDGWKVNGDIPGPHSALQVLGFLGRHLPNIMSFQPPSQEWLDEQFPVAKMNWEQILNPPPLHNDNNKIQVTWLGHSSLLVQMGSRNGQFTILTDPVFSDRCSPSQWYGPRRYRPPPCTIDELCDKLLQKQQSTTSTSSDLIVLISHNHYDHLDYATVQTICQKYGDKNVRFVVPLGVREWFRRHVSTEVPIYELDWHESVEYSPYSTDNDDETSSSSADADGSLLRIDCVPMRHWSNRTGDRDETLWCGYSLTTTTTTSSSSISSSVSSSDDGSKDTDTTTCTKKFLFPGDTAWFDGLSDSVGAQYGPWDVAAIPIGAYEPRDFMKTNHINVAEAIQMKDVLDAKAAVPIHWGTFPVTIEPVMEPRERLVEGMKGRPDEDTFVPWHIGETKVF